MLNKMLPESQASEVQRENERNFHSKKDNIRIHLDMFHHFHSWVKKNFIFSLVGWVMHVLPTHYTGYNFSSVKLFLLLEYGKSTCNYFSIMVQDNQHQWDFKLNSALFIYREPDKRHKFLFFIQTLSFSKFLYSQIISNRCCWG